MSIAILNRMSYAFNVANRPDAYMTIDPVKGLTATSKKEQQADLYQILDRVMLELEAFTAQEHIEGDDPDKKEKNKELFRQLKARVRTYFKGKVKKSHPKMAALFMTHFPLAKARWKLAQGVHKFEIEIKPDRDDNSIQGFRLINGSENAAKMGDLDTLCYPRDTLFLQQQLQSHLKRLSLVQLEICNRMSNTLDAKQEICCIAEVGEVKPYRDEDELFYEEEEGSSPALFWGASPVDEAGIELQELVKKVACYLANERAVREEKISRAVEPLLKRLLAYGQQSQENQVFVDECIDILKINELVAIREQLLDEWQKSDFCAGGYTYNEKARQLFQSVGYLPRRHLAFLAKIGRSLFDYIDKTTQESIPHVVNQQKKVCELFYATICQLQPDPQKELYNKLTRSLNKVIQRFLSDSKDDAKRYQEVMVITTDLRPCDEEYEEYRFADISPKAYNELSELPVGLFQDPWLVVSKVHKRLGSVSPKNVGGDRGYSYLPPSQKKQIQPAKPKRSSAASDSSNSSSPATSARSSPELHTDALQQVTQAIAKMTLKAVSAPPAAPSLVVPKPLSKVTLKTPLSAPTRKKPLQEKPVVTAVAKLIYDDRVLRWNQDRLAVDDPVKTDPFYVAKNLTLRQRVWVHISHNFARIVDDFIDLGAQETNRKNLEHFAAARQVQLVGDITRIVNHRTERKKGFFAYSQSETSIWFHRYFSVKPKESEIIDKQYAERAWEVLKNPPVPNPDASKPNLVAKDGSYVEYQSPELIVIYDPKNRVRIRIVPNINL